MTTYSALTTLPGQDTAEALAEAMENMSPEPYGVGVFEIEDGSGLWEVGGYFLEQPDDAVLLLLSTAFGAKPFVVSELPDIDWVAKVRRDLVPVEAGRFWLVWQPRCRQGAHGRRAAADRGDGCLWHRPVMARRWAACGRSIGWRQAG